MVQLTKTAISLALSLIGLNVNAALATEASDVLKAFPELAGKGDLAVAYKDPQTHEIVRSHVSVRSVEKRACMFVSFH